MTVPNTFSVEEIQLLNSYVPKDWFQERREKHVKKVLTNERKLECTMSASASGYEKVAYVSARNRSMSNTVAGIIMPMPKTRHCHFSDEVVVHRYELALITAPSSLAAVCKKE